MARRFLSVDLLPVAYGLAGAEPAPKRLREIELTIDLWIEIDCRTFMLVVHSLEFLEVFELAISVRAGDPGHPVVLQLV